MRFQGPRANGMPELHKLTPPLGVLQDRGFKVALVTDGRMSGASRQGAGRDPRHARRRPSGGPLARLRDGDLIRLDAARGRLEALVDEAEWSWRDRREPRPRAPRVGAWAASCSPPSAPQVTSAERGAARSSSCGAADPDEAEADAQF